MAFLPRTPGRATQKKLDSMRRAFIMTLYTDLKLFGYRTESVQALQKRIAKEKQGINGTTQSNRN